MKPPHGRLSEAQADCCLAPGRGALFDSRPPRRFSSRKTILRSSPANCRSGQPGMVPSRRHAVRRADVAVILQEISVAHGRISAALPRFSMIAGR